MAGCSVDFKVRRRVGGLLELAPRCRRSGDAGAAINPPPAPPPRPLPPPAQPSADAQSGTGRLEGREAGRPACLNVYVGCIGKTASRHNREEDVLIWGNDKRAR